MNTQVHGNDIYVPWTRSSFSGIGTIGLLVLYPRDSFPIVVQTMLRPEHLLPRRSLRTLLSGVPAKHLPHLRPHQWTFQVLRLHPRLRWHNPTSSRRQTFQSQRLLFRRLLR